LKAVCSGTTDRYGHNCGIANYSNSNLLGKCFKIKTERVVGSLVMVTLSRWWSWSCQK